MRSPALPSTYSWVAVKESRVKLLVNLKQLIIIRRPISILCCLSLGSITAIQIVLGRGTKSCLISSMLCYHTSPGLDIQEHAG